MLNFRYQISVKPKGMKWESVDIDDMSPKTKNLYVSNTRTRSQPDMSNFHLPEPLLEVSNV